VEIVFLAFLAYVFHFGNNSATVMAAVVEEAA